MKTYKTNEIISLLLDKSKKNGATDTEVIISKSYGKSLEVRNNVKENGKTRPICDYRNDDVWDKTYIGRTEILMPTTGTDAKGNPVRKKKYLYFQMN